METKGKRKFQLDKSSTRNFDISKGSKRKFDLSKDEDDVVAVTASNASEKTPTSVADSKVNNVEKVNKPTTVEAVKTVNEVSNDSDNGNKSNGKKWLWIIAVIVLALLVWWLIPKSQDSSSEEPQPTEDVINTVDSSDTENPSDTSQENAAGDAQVSQNVDEQEVAPNSKPSPTHAELPQNANEQSANAPIVQGDVETEAYKVIRGEYGVGQERVDRLGSQYQAIQNRVNEMKREGLF